MVKGTDEVLAAIRALRAKGRNAQERALTEMSNDFREVLESNVPIGMKHGNTIPLKSDTQIGKIRRRQGELSVRIGFAGSASTGPLPAWYAHFTDTGSMKNAPSFFSTRSRAQATPELVQIMIEAFRRELGS